MTDQLIMYQLEKIEDILVKVESDQKHVAALVLETRRKFDALRGTLAPEQLLTVSSAAEKCCLSTQYLHKSISAGRLPVVLIDGVKFVAEPELEKWMNG